MKTDLKMNNGSASEAGPQSLAELFHLVESLIPEDQEVISAKPDMTVAEAVGIMQKRSFSQLPVVAGNTVLGVFSFRSLCSNLLNMSPMKEHFGDLPVDEFMEQFQFVHPSDNWESTLDYLNRDIGVLVGHRERLDGIVTAMDVLFYLQRIASPFVMLAEIELSLRRSIEACVSTDELRQCVQNSLAHKYTADEMPTALSDMTFDDYVQIIGHGHNWPHFSPIFGESEWQRKTTASRLREIRDLRNVVFHFRRPLTSNDHKILAERREWLQMKTRAFEAKQQYKPAAPEGKQKATKGRWDEPTFFQELAARHGPIEVEVARTILAWARSSMPSIWWGKGQRFGSFIPGLDHKGVWHQAIGVWTYGRLDVQFQYMQGKPPFDSEEKRRQLLTRLNAIAGISLPEDAITKRPGIPLSDLADETTLKRFLEVFDWFVEEVRAT